jgi:predicted PurR-regulated permease PerM
MTEQRPELARITLSVLFIGGLIAGSLWILSPFLAAFIWATMIVVATWPVMRSVERALGGRRAPAVAVMTIGLLAILIVPLVGERLQAAWNQLAREGAADLLAQAQPYARAAAEWFAHQAGSFALVLVQFLLIAILAAVLYSGGESWVAWLRRFGRRLADEQGDRMVVLAGQAIRGVALGVVVTALVQSALGGIGLAIAGVPFAGVLTAIMFALCIAQLGPLLVLLGATAWAYYALGTGWGTFLLVWSLVVGVMDNFLRPILIRRGADLPLLLIFAGVIGGLVAFGVIGIFVGPVVLAVAYTLLDSWVDSAPPGSAAAQATGITTNSPSSTPTV